MPTSDIAVHQSLIWTTVPAAGDYLHMACGLFSAFGPLGGIHFCFSFNLIPYQVPFMRDEWGTRGQS